MLLEMAIGDAYGVGFEFRQKSFVEGHNNLEKYYPHERYTSLYKKYSDDTQMSIGIAELMLEQETWTEQSIADKFVTVFKRDMRKGYSAGFYEFLCGVKDGVSFMNTIQPNSDRGGAAMRSSLIGLYPSIEEILERSRQHAQLTHNTLIGIQSAQASALLLHYFYYKKGNKKKVGSWLNSTLNVDWIQAWEGEVGQRGDEPVRAAITALQKHDDLASILKTCIAFSGDVDTVATIAMGAAFCAEEIENNLPRWMYDELENEKYGYDYIRNLDELLLAKFSR